MKYLPLLTVALLLVFGQAHADEIADAQALCDAAGVPRTKPTTRRELSFEDCVSRTRNQQADDRAHAAAAALAAQRQQQGDPK